MFKFSSEKNIISGNNKSTIETNKKIESIEIKSLRDPMEQVLSQMRSKLEAGEYNVIISDDASGRVASLTLSNIINNIYQEHGYKKPEHLFLAGQRLQDSEVKSKEIGEHLEKIFKERKLDRTQKVLIVTDTIQGGTSLTPVTKYLTEQGIEHDIVTMSFSGGHTDTKSSSELEKMFHGNIYGPTKSYNSFNSHPIYGQHHLAGITKNTGDILSHRYEKYDGNIVKQARNDIKILSKDLIRKYKNNKSLPDKTRPSVKEKGLKDSFFKDFL